MFVPYVYVSIESTNYILSSSLALNAILLTSLVYTLRFSLLNFAVILILF